MNEKIERSISFATSNSHKFREVELVLRRLGVGVRRLRGKGLEIQSGDIVGGGGFAGADASKSMGAPSSSRILAPSSTPSAGFRAPTPHSSSGRVVRGPSCGC